MPPQLKHTHGIVEPCLVHLTSNSKKHKPLHTWPWHMGPDCAGESCVISICHGDVTAPTTDPRPAGLVQRPGFPSATLAPISTLGREPTVCLSEQALSRPTQAVRCMYILCSPCLGVGTPPMTMMEPDHSLRQSGNVLQLHGHFRIDVRKCF